MTSLKKKFPFSPSLPWLSTAIRLQVSTYANSKWNIQICIQRGGNICCLNENCLDCEGEKRFHKRTFLPIKFSGWKFDLFILRLRLWNVYKTWTLNGQVFPKRLIPIISNIGGEWEEVFLHDKELIGNSVEIAIFEWNEWLPYHDLQRCVVQ